jgi:hypothetical protein
MTELELAKEINSTAEYHLNCARKQELLIGQTKLGTLRLSYENKIYELVQCGNPLVEPRVVAAGAKKIVKEALMNAYQIIL